MTSHGLPLRTKAEPDAMAADLRNALRSVKADLSFSRERTLDNVLSESLRIALRITNFIRETRDGREALAHGRIISRCHVNAHSRS